jgi:predicted outer membrane repeat protein
MAAEDILMTREIFELCRKKMRWTSYLRAALFVAAACALGAKCDPGAIIRVTTTADGERGSLRAAITEANRARNSAVRVEVPPGTYELSVCGSDDNNRAGDLDITTPVSFGILATGPGVTVVQTCAGERVLDGRGAGPLVVEGVTFKGGRASENGGAIRGGSVSLVRVTLSNNQAPNGAGIAATTLVADETTIAENTTPEIGDGGGILVSGQVALRNSTVRGNSAGTRGGGISAGGKVTLFNSTVRANRVLGFHLSPPRAGETLPAPEGGGILADAVEADRVTIADNITHSCASFTDVEYPKPFGAAISARTVKLTNATVSGHESVDCNTPLRGGAGTVLAASESLHMDHVTLFSRTPRLASVGMIRTPELTVHRSALIGIEQLGRPAVPLCDSTTKASESAYNLFTDPSCGVSGNMVQRDDVWLSDLRDNAGAVPTLSMVPAFVDKIPLEACPVRIDTLGIERPQSTGCDIGAEEAVPPPGTGTADLSLTWSGPESMIVGETGTWRLSIQNKGPNAARLDAFLSSTAGGVALVATHSGRCSGEWCAIDHLPAGQTATITATSSSWSTAALGFTLAARVNTLFVAPPFADDQATMAVSQRVDSTLALDVSTSGTNVTVKIQSLGPYAAMGVGEQPIRFEFHPAPEVTAWTPIFPYFYGPLFVGSSFDTTFTIQTNGPPPAQLGTIELHPGLNAVQGPLVVPVLYAPAANAHSGAP